MVIDLNSKTLQSDALKISAALCESETLKESSFIAISETESSWMTHTQVDILSIVTISGLRLNT